MKRGRFGGGGGGGGGGWGVKMLGRRRWVLISEWTYRGIRKYFEIPRVDQRRS